MKTQFQLRINSLDLGQVLDGLNARAEAWQKTADFLATGQITGDPFICEECSDADEAAAIARYFSKIISQIERQVAEQGGWQ